MVSFANGHNKNVWETSVLGMALAMQGYEAKLNFQVMHLARAYIYLGREWLYSLGSIMYHGYQDKCPKLMYEGRLVRLQVELTILATPCISSIEIFRAYEKKKIEQVYVVRPLHTFVFLMKLVS